MKMDKKFYLGMRPAAVMLLCSCIAFSASASYLPQEGTDVPIADAPVNAPLPGASKETSPTLSVASTAPSAETEERAYEPAPYLLNLAHYNPEGSEDSWAEVLMKELIQKDSRWYSEIYDMANTAPQKLAARLGKPASSTMGKYNPASKTQKEEDSSTWAVEHFKNVRISFYNGDGEVTSAVSNAQDILSMANVYAYYNHAKEANPEQLRGYLDQLWSASHSYSASMGDVYYCEGCVNPDEITEEEADSELENEDSFQSGRTIDTEIESGTPSESATSSENAEDPSIPPSAAAEQESTVAHSESVSAVSEGNSETVGSEAVGSEAAGSAAVGSEAAGSETAGSEAVGSETAGSETAGSEAVGSEAAGSETAGSSQAANGEITNSGEATSSMPKETFIEADSVVIITEPETTERQTTDFVWEPETEAPPVIIRLDEESGSDKTEAAPEADSTQNEASGSLKGVNGEPSGSPEGGIGEAGAKISQEISALVATSSEASKAESTEAASKKDLDEAVPAPGPNNKVCPGHVDLKITAKIHTLSEKSNLYLLDQKGNTVTEGEEWQGWTSRTKAFVRHINRQNWIEEYGMNITVPGTKAPLSSAEIESYMSQLPQDTTEERKNIVRFALQSVGKVPYYWGGKPSSKNYTGNSFGSVTIPDHRGRILRGLDCSGWINWIYWSVTGNRLPYEGTGGLSILGKQVARQDLKPGDIIVVTGSTPHVIMFMNWTADGQIQCVHETGSSNNVIVGAMTANWPYYRNLLD